MLFNAKQTIVIVESPWHLLWYISHTWILDIYCKS